ncbi:hypothetical protein TNCV_1914091 [Trichonephila clavipes]|nr:hypothetical protein TNCV_1914091 [Trichonephila clavipes]
MAVRTPAVSDPEHSNGTPLGSEVIPLAQHPISEIPLAMRETNANEVCRLCDHAKMDENHLLQPLDSINTRLTTSPVYTGRFGANSCQVIYSQFGLAIHQNDHQARRRFVDWAQNEIAVVPYFHKRILFSDEAHFCVKGYVNKQNCRIWSEANPQVYVETPLHPEKLTVWCALWAGGILLQKR